jgi:hypothetical protein
MLTRRTWIISYKLYSTVDGEAADFPSVVQGKPNWSKALCALAVHNVYIEISTLFFTQWPRLRLAS